MAFSDGPYLEIVKDGSSITPNITGNIVPDMTSNSTPSGIASASSVYMNEGTRPPWHAFDRNDETEWRPATADSLAWLQYEFPVARIIGGYYIRASSLTEVVSIDNVTYSTPGSLRAPRTWRVEGSNDAGATWTLLDSQVGQVGWGDGERRYYTFKNKDAFLIYRLSITAANTNPSQARPMSISEWAMVGTEEDTPVIRLTVSDIAEVNRGAGFKVTDAGRHLRVLNEDAYWHWFTIKERISNDTVDAELKSPPLPSLSRLRSYRLGAFSVSDGYPGAIAKYQERIFYARTDASPETVWGSQRGDFENFGTSTPMKDDDAISLTLNDVGEITWLIEGGDLLIGGVASVRSLGPADKSKGFSATNFQQGRPVRGGASSSQPVSTGEVGIFVDRYGKSFRELSFSFDSAGYVAPDLSVLSEHILAAGVTELGFAREPNAVIWGRLADGQFSGTTYEREQKTVGFHKHGLAESGNVRSLCSTPGLSRDQVWFVTRRAGQQSILRLAEDYEPDPNAPNEAPVEAFYVDEGLTYRGAPVTTVTGLGHLAGKSVAVLADGAIEVGAVVTGGGSLTLPSGVPASVIHVGLDYGGQVKTLRIAQGGGDGSGLGRKKRVHSVIVDWLAASGLSVKGKGQAEVLMPRATDDRMDRAPGLNTGSTRASIDDRWDGEGVVEINAFGPLPSTIRAITLAFEGEP